MSDYTMSGNVTDSTVIQRDLNKVINNSIKHHENSANTEQEERAKSKVVQQILRENSGKDE